MCSLRSRTIRLSARLFEQQSRHDRAASPRCTQRLLCADKRSARRESTSRSSRSVVSVIHAIYQNDVCPEKEGRILLVMDPIVISRLAERADDNVLGLLSRTSLWSDIAPHLRDQSFWFRRLEFRYNLPDYMQWEGNEKEIWYQIYNILTGLSTENPFSSANISLLERNGFNALAVRYLLSRYDPSVDSSVSLASAAKYGSPDTVRLLLSDPRIDPLARSAADEGAYQALTLAAMRGSIPIMQALLEDARISTPAMRTPALKGAARADKAEAARFLLDLSPYTYVELHAMMTEAVKNDALSIFDLVDTDPLFSPSMDERKSLAEAAVISDPQVNQVIVARRGQQAAVWL